MRLKLFMMALPLLFLWGCDCESGGSKPEWQKINGRNMLPVYQARVPLLWIRKDPQEAIEDTTKSLVEFRIDDDILITVHNFPDIRIPPNAQVTRWKKQFKLPSSIEACSHGGFAGLQFESKGCLAFAMQLDPDHYQKLHGKKQMKADYTIKAIGPSKKLDRHRAEIIEFAHSFELIDEIPK